MSRSITARFFAGVAVLSLLVVPMSALAAHAPATKHPCKATSKPQKTHKLATTAAQPVITFGIQGGNIQPWSVSIDGNGTVTTTGWMTVHNQHLAEPTNTLNGLFKLADTEGFFSMASSTSCSGSLPDIASRYIEMNSASGSHKVVVHGTCVPNFNELFAVLENGADIQH